MKKRSLLKWLLISTTVVSSLVACGGGDDDEYIEEIVNTTVNPVVTPTDTTSTPLPVTTPTTPTTTANAICSPPTVLPTLTASSIPALYPSAACGTLITDPLKVQLQKTTPDGIGPALVANMTIGNSPITSNLLVDSGSPALVVSCTTVLPNDLCTSDGILLNNNMQEINGITVTTLKTIAAYGSSSYVGHVAYAPVTFNQTSQGKVTTGVMPILIWYKHTGSANFDGILGVNNGPTVPANENSILLNSPIHYVNFAPNLDAGLVVRPLGDISTWNMTSSSCLSTLSCPSTTDQFILGIDQTTSNLFTQQTSQTPLATLQPNDFPAGAYSVTVNACFNVPDGNYCMPTMFDTGTLNAGYYYGAPASTSSGSTTNSPTTTGSSSAASSPTTAGASTTQAPQPPSLPSNTNISVSVGNQQWAFNVGQQGGAMYAWNFGPAAPNSPLTKQLVGLPYFFSNSYLLNFTDAKIGILMGQ